MRVCSESHFFFQAEDGIRYPLVTGVQTCALPICSDPDRSASRNLHRRRARPDRYHAMVPDADAQEIGRASCRERVYIAVAAVTLKKKNKIIRHIVSVRANAKTTDPGRSDVIQCIN